MKTVSNSLLAIQIPSRPSSMTRGSDFIELMKPRVMLLAVFTALVGLLIAPVHLDFLHQLIAVLAIAVGAGAAAALNMWFDADIDALMARTAKRPLPRGRITRREALLFGLTLASCAVSVLAIALNVTAAALLAFAIFFYVVVYTAWLKRRTPQNIVIGGAAGALPPVIGWAAATGDIGMEPLVLFLMIFLWTPPHFWALCINRTDDYSRAGVPMLPVSAGWVATTKQILIYRTVLVVASMLPWVVGLAGTIYVAFAVAGGTMFVALAWRLRKSAQTDRTPAHRLFAFSIFYLFVLFAALLASSGRNEWPTRFFTYVHQLSDIRTARLWSNAGKIACGSKHEGGISCASQH